LQVIINGEGEDSTKLKSVKIKFIWIDLVSLKINEDIAKFRAQNRQIYLKIRVHQKSKDHAPPDLAQRLDPGRANVAKAAFTRLHWGVFAL